MKRYAVPVVAGVLVFGVVTGFAATLDVTTTTLGSGDEVVDSCNATADVTYTTGWDTTLDAYEVLTSPIVTATTCNGLAYKVTLTGTDGAGEPTVLKELTGALDTNGAAAPDFTTFNVSAQSVTGVSVVITG